MAEKKGAAERDNRPDAHALDVRIMSAPNL